MTQHRPDPKWDARRGDPDIWVCTICARDVERVIYNKGLNAYWRHRRRVVAAP